MQIYKFEPNSDVFTRNLLLLNKLHCPNMTDQVEIWQQQLLQAARPDKIETAASFFKTGKGEYAEGDIFIGLTVPDNRAISKQYCQLPMADFARMLASEVHEIRFAALIALTYRYKTVQHDQGKARQIVDFYLSQSKRINNWDLVDCSAHKILGQYMVDFGEYDLAHRLSHSSCVWDVRIAMISTYQLIQAGKLDLTFTLAQQLLAHPHDLIRKAVGWMLREAGKKDRNRLIAFLDQYAPTMARTTLRIAIERLDNATRRYYMTLRP